MIDKITSEYFIKESYGVQQVSIRLLLNHRDNTYQVMPNNYDRFEFFRGSLKNNEMHKAVARAIIKAVEFAEKELTNP